jgi:tetratricopeptide (TPR) repeat protein
VSASGGVPSGRRNTARTAYRGRTRRRPPLDATAPTDHRPAQRIRPLGRPVHRRRRRSRRSARRLRLVLPGTAPAAARTFRLLGLHPGPHIGVPAAAALTAQPRERTAALLDLLTGAHLLEQTGPSYYQFHDLLRAYAADQARHEDTHDEQHAALTRLASWYLHSAYAAVHAADTFNPPALDPPTDPAIDPITFQDYPSALRWHHDEQANLLAVARATAAAGLDQITWQLPVTLHGLHRARHLLDDWLEMATLGLHAAERLSDRHAQALLHETLGTAHTAAGRLDHAATHHTTALNLHTDLGDQAGTIEANHRLGLVYLRQRDLPRAQACFEQTLTHARHPSHDDWLAPALCCLAFTHAEAGQSEPAAHLAEQSLSELATRPAAATYLRIDPLLVLARLRREAGDLEAATTFLDQAAALVQPLEHPALKHAVLRERADLEHAYSHNDQAFELYWDYLTQQRTIGDRTHQAHALDAIACTLRALGRLDEALEFHRTATHLSRHPTQPWHLALALTHLADTLTAADQTEQAKTTRTEAHTLLATFTDPRAAALRHHLDNAPDRTRGSKPPTSA